MGERVSLPYVEATIHTLRQFGVKVKPEKGCYFIPADQSYRPCTVRIPGDFSSAAFMMAGAAVTRGSVTISGLDFDAPQGDSVFPEILRRMGGLVKVRRESGEVTVEGGSSLTGGVFNLSNSPDLAPVMASLIPITEGEIKLTGVAHLRFKETDRIATLTHGLRRMGHYAHAEPDGMTMKKGTPKKAAVDSYGDHRLLMAFTIIGLSPNSGLTIRDNESVDVSYPRFIEDIHALGGRVKKA
jgi:3-phosphoshikimate 1-carboxyvinyltransferase